MNVAAHSQQAAGERHARTLREQCSSSTAPPRAQTMSPGSSCHPNETALCTAFETIRLDTPQKKNLTSWTEGIAKVSMLKSMWHPLGICRPNSDDAEGPSRTDRSSLIAFHALETGVEVW